jgi:hypothetical protein
VTAPALTGLEVAGDGEQWRAAGFTVDGDGGCRVGHVRMQTGVGTKGIGSWTLAPATTVAPAGHANGSNLLDHLVVFTGDPDRTVESYAELGLDVRRVRDLGNGTRQTFFKAGEVIIELVGPIPNVTGERLWGLAFTVDDLDACAAMFGERLGAIKDAVQPHRRIATLRHKEFGLTIPIAFMSDEETDP